MISLSSNWPGLRHGIDDARKNVGMTTWDIIPELNPAGSGILSAGFFYWEAVDWKQV